MTSKPIPPFLLDVLDYLHLLKKKHSKKELSERNEKLLEVIQKLYGLGWKYDEVINCFGNYSENIKNIKKIALYVYSRAEILNPFGYWLTFRKEFPFQVYLFNRKVIKNNSITVAGLIFSILLISKNKLHNKKKTVLENAISRSKENIDKYNKLTEIKNKNDYFFITKPSLIGAIAGIDNKTIQKNIKIINEALNISLEIFTESYFWGGLRSRSWVSGAEQLSEAFSTFTNENIENFSTLFDRSSALWDGGLDILQLDDSLRRNENRQEYEYNVIINKTLKPDDSATRVKKKKKKKKYFLDCLISNGKLKNYYEKYESLFKYTSMGYLSQHPIESNPFLRIFYKNKSYIIACQSDFLNYKLLLSTLYDDGKGLSKRLKHIKFLESCDFNTIRSIKSRELLSAVAKIRFNLLTKGILKKQYPVCDPDNQSLCEPHFDQINEVTSVVDNISTQGIPIIKENLQNLKEELIARLESKVESTSMSDSTNEISDDLQLFCFEELIASIKTAEIIKRSSVDSIKNNIKTIKSIEEQIEGGLYSKKDRIYGQFTPNSSNTHRMTCRRINLQGLPKELRDSLFANKDDWRLLSADISGQDIAITASLAHKIALDNSLVITENTESLNIIKTNIEETINKIINAEPDIISDITLKVFEIVEKRFRKVTKQFIYIVFYGGSKSTLMKDLKKELSDKIQNIITKANSSDFNRNLINFDHLWKKYKKIKDMDNYFNYLDEYKSKYLKDVNSTSMELIYFNSIYRITEEKKLIYSRIDTIEDTIRNEYPGLLNTFDILHEYISNHPNRLTYPTLLGWQTVVNKVYINSTRDLITKGKSYPVQASGAEFIREWIFQLKKSEYYYNKFWIVSVIHDQIVVLCDVHNKEDIKTLLQSTKDEAARNLDLNPELFRIPDIEVIGTQQ